MGKTSLALNIAQHVGTKTEQHGRRVQPRDVARAALPAHAVLRGADRRPRAADGVPAQRRLGAAHRGARRAGPGEGLHRRHAVDRRAGDARQVAAARRRARPAPARRRLHPADAGPGAVRQPDAGTRRDLAGAQGPGQGAGRPGRRAVAAQPGAGGAVRPSAAALRPARVGRPRAGRRRRHPHLPRGLLQPGRPGTTASPRSSWPSSATGRPTPSSSPSSKSARASRTTIRACRDRPPGRPRSGAAWSVPPSLTSIWPRCRPTTAPSKRFSHRGRLRRTARPPSSPSSRRMPTATGHGTVALALERAGASMLACADIEEGVALRRAGVGGRILVFGALSVSDLAGLFDYDLTPTCSTPGAGRALQAAAAARGKRLRYHLKIDTGLNRLGFRHDNLAATLPDAVREPGPRSGGRLHALRDRRRSRASAVRAAALAVRRRARPDPPDGCRRAGAPRGQQRGAAAGFARLVRVRAPRSAALRRHAGRVAREAAAAPGDVAPKPHRLGQARAGGRGGRIRGAVLARHAARRRHRACRLCRRPRHQARRPRGACWSAAGARRSSARCRWTCWRWM